MNATEVTTGQERTWVLVYDAGDAVMRELTAFARERRLPAARFQAIGAFSEATLGWFDWDARDYERLHVAEQVEVLALLGDIVEHEAQPAVHAHVVVGKRDGSAHGGHLLEATVRPTLELVITEVPRHLRKRHDPASGLPLIDLSA